MAPVPEVFPLPAPTAIATYDYVDISELTGVTIYLGINEEDSSAKGYFLSRTDMYSDSLLTQTDASPGSTSDVLALDIDFDLKFNAPQRIKGTFRANIPVIWGDETNGNEGGTIYVKYIVRHWDGSTETDLGTVTSKTSGTAVSMDTEQIMFNVEVPVTTTKQFEAGDTLRLTVQVFANTQSAGTHLALMHDPKNREPTSAEYSNGIDTGEFLTSILSFHVPTLLDI